MLLHPVLALLKIVGNQILAELFPFAFAKHSVIVAASVVPGEVVGHGARYAVVTHDAQREQSVSIAAFMLGQVVPVEFAVSPLRVDRSAEHPTELQSLMRISYDVFCWK